MFRFDSSPSFFKNWYLTNELLSTARMKKQNLNTEEDQLTLYYDQFTTKEENIKNIKEKINENIKTLEINGKKKTRKKKKKFLISIKKEWITITVSSLKMFFLKDRCS